MPAVCATSGCLTSTSRPPALCRRIPGKNVNYLRPYKGYAAIQQEQSNGSSVYSSLQVSWNRRFTAGSHVRCQLHLVQEPRQQFELSRHHARHLLHQESLGSVGVRHQAHSADQLPIRSAVLQIAADAHRQAAGWLAAQRQHSVPNRPTLRSRSQQRLRRSGRSRQLRLRHQYLRRAVLGEERNSAVLKHFAPNGVGSANIFPRQMGMDLRSLPSRLRVPSICNLEYATRSTGPASRTGI